MNNVITKRKFHIFLLCAILALTAVFGLSACKTDGNDDDDYSQLVEVTNVTLDSQTLNLEVGASKNLIATVLPENASNKTVTWISLDPTVAAVENGRVTGVKQGVTAITAVCGIRSANCIVTVTDGSLSQIVEITSVTLDLQTLGLQTGESRTLTATVLPENASNKTVTWISLDPTVAAVANGNVTALKAGVTSVTAVCGLMSASCIVTVTDKPIEDEKPGIKFDKTSFMMYIGDSRTINATVNIGGDGDKTLTWLSSDEKVATVSGGKVKALKAGMSIIVATCGDYSASCTVTVAPVETTGITLDKTAATVYIGDSVELEATVLPENATNKTVLWSSLDTSVARVTNGRVTGVSKGSTVITALCASTNESFTATCVVTVLDGKVTGLSFDKSEHSMFMGDSFTLTPTVKPDYAKDKTVIWESSDESVATVENGVVTALSDGTVTITGKAGDFEAKCEVTVSDPDPITKIEVMGENSAFIDLFALSDYKLKTTRRSGKTENIELKREYISEEDYKKLESVGEHTLTLNYKGVRGQWNITVKNHDFEGVEFLSQTYLYDGNAKSLEVAGAPEGTEIVYENNVQTDIGEYTARATLSKQYYNTKTLTAKLTIELKERNVTYVLGYDGVTNENPAKFNVMLGLKLVAPVRSEITDGKYFNGWYTDENYFAPVTKIAAGTDEDVTLYAKWERPYTVNSSGAVEVNYFGMTMSEITVLPVIDGIKVTAIGFNGFDGCKSLTSINLPDGLTSIRAAAFQDCESLTSITIPEKVTSIGEYAFNNCTGLERIILPESLTSIGELAFNNCESLKSITLPEKVTSIGAKAFKDCESLKSITIPQKMTSIENYVFYNCTSLSSITLPDGLTSIGYGAFHNCTSLTGITLPDSLTSIGDNAFEFCESLISITIPEGVTSIGEDTFFNCTKLSDITIPEGVTSIGFRAFYTCGRLASITLPDSLTSIGDEAFIDCANLTSINIPVGVTSIGERTFLDCENLSSITIPEGVTSIGERAFFLCRSLSSITLPDSLTSIGSEAFLTSNLQCKSIVIPNNVTSIGAGAFALVNLESIRFKEGTGNDVYHISDNCLIETATKTLVAGCKGSVIPDDGSVTVIGEGAFKYSGITSITIPECIVKICKNAFYGCYRGAQDGLKSVILENTAWSYINSSGEEIIISPHSLGNPSEAAIWLGGDRAGYEWRRRIK